MSVLAAGAGLITASLTLRRGAVCAVEIGSTRPLGLARVFVGRPADDVPLLVRQIFSLCGFSQMSAARLALASAKGHSLSASDRFALSLGILAERAFETLRSLVMGWPDAPPEDVARAAPALRDSHLAAQALMAAASSGLAHRRLNELTEPVARLVAAGKTLGLSDPNRPGALLHAMKQDCAAERAFAYRVPDALNPAYDGEVALAMAMDEAFCSLPAVAGLTVETGAFALCHDRVQDTRNALEARLEARLIDLSDTLKALERAVASGASDDETLIDARSTNAGEGVGIVECARGRLYHLARLHTDGRVKAYRILAPTEWNFHPAGPFVASLLSSPIGEGEVAMLKVRRLAALFDPCVAFDLSVKAPAHA